MSGRHEYAQEYAGPGPRNTSSTTNQTLQSQRNDKEKIAQNGVSPLAVGISLTLV